MEAFQDIRNHSEIIMFIDEVGTGTQEVSGFEYGKRLLKKLAGLKCSIVASTQITDLAKFAEQELGATCFNFDLKHRVKPGIGSGGLEKLISKLEMDKLL